MYSSVKVSYQGFQYAFLSLNVHIVPVLLSLCFVKSVSNCFMDNCYDTHIYRFTHAFLVTYDQQYPLRNFQNFFKFLHTKLQKTLFSYRNANCNCTGTTCLCGGMPLSLNIIIYVKLLQTQLISLFANVTDCYSHTDNVKHAQGTWLPTYYRQLEVVLLLTLSSVNSRIPFLLHKLQKQPMQLLNMLCSCVANKSQ